MTVFPNHDREHDVEETDHGFEVGDHIYRRIWAPTLLMQHHAIVLYIGKENVIIFDLNAADRQSPSSIGSTSSNSYEPSDSDNENNVVILQRHIPLDELRCWHKVLYGANLFRRATSIPGTVTARRPYHPSIVVSRAKFIIENKDLIPRYDVVESNCECVAIWCKTGEWCTLQVLQTRIPTTVAAGAAGAGAMGTTVTVPCAGIWGWLGFTTQVPFYVANPLLAPVLIGGALVGVNITQKYLVKKKFGEIWKETGDKLNEKYWNGIMNKLPEHLVDHIHGFLDVVHKEEGSDASVSSTTNNDSTTNTYNS